MGVIGALSHEAVHVSDIGLGTAHDEEILEYSAKKKMILVTRDLDFGTLAVYLRIKTYGIVILRLPFLYTAKEINSSINLFLSTVNAKRLRKAVAIVEPGRYRIRKL